MIYMYFLLSLFVFLQQVEHQQKEEMEFDLMMIPIRSPDNTHQKKINQKLVLKSDLPLIPNCAKWLGSKENEEQAEQIEKFLLGHFWK